MREEQKKTVSVLLPLDLYEQLSQSAEKSSRSMSAYIRQVLKWHLMYMDQFSKR